MKSLSIFWKVMIPLSLLCGVLLRVLFVEDMEYKEDEMINFTATVAGPDKDNWPWSGMPSGVFLKNPGASIWVFTALARITHALTPTQLCTAVQIFSLLGISLILPFLFRSIEEKHRNPWLWAFALAMVNPLAVYYQRKLWPEPFLPFFSMLIFFCWWHRSQHLAALGWGLFAAFIGQIHMSGFFLAGGLFLWTIFFEKKVFQKNQHTSWIPWLVGSVIGALPLIPWILEIRSQPPAQSVGFQWDELLQFKFWVFWISNPLGLHLGNALGVLKGNSHWEQLSDFIRYPILFGTPTYLNALAHLILLGGGGYALIQGVLHLVSHWKPLKNNFISKENTTFLVQAIFWGCGILLTLTSVKIRRYYLMVVFPLDFVWLVSLFYLYPHRWTQRLLTLLWSAELFVSACFVGYIHVNEGALQGDYGPAYHKVIQTSSPQQN